MSDHQDNECRSSRFPAQGPNLSIDQNFTVQIEEVGEAGAPTIRPPSSVDMQY